MIRSNSSNDTLSRRTLEDTPGRTLKFVRAVGTHPAIREALRAVGYTKEVHRQGCDLLYAVGDIAFGPAPPPQPNVVDQGLANVQLWGGANLARAHASLVHRFPDQAAFLFQGLGPPRGPEAPLVVATFLDRCDALEHGPERKTTRKVDHSALGLLAERGITKEARKKIREDLDLLGTHDEPPAAVKHVEKREAELRALHFWITEWTEIARTLIVRRDLRIKLGVAKRRAKGASATPVVVTPAAPPVQPSPAPPAALRIPTTKGAELGTGTDG